MSKTGNGWGREPESERPGHDPQRASGKHGIEPGSRVRIRENENGEIVVEPLPNLLDFRGAATTSDRGTALLQEARAVDEERSQRLERGN